MRTTGPGGLVRPDFFRSPLPSGCGDGPQGGLSQPLNRTRNYL